MQAAIDELGEAALSDQAVIWIANQQVNEERRKGQWLERVAAYQDKHPHLGWQTCEENIKMGLQ